jgi:hypothetical protein
MKNRNLPWAAGLFEGEGTITIAKRSLDMTYRIVVIVGNTDRQIIRFFQTRWPGWVQPAYGERPGRKPSWCWTVAGPAAVDFITEILPYLITSRVRQKARLALLFRKNQSRRKRDWNKSSYKPIQARLYARMRVLNKRGVDRAPSF